MFAQAIEIADNDMLTFLQLTVPGLFVGALITGLLVPRRVVEAQKRRTDEQEELIERLRVAQRVLETSRRNLSLPTCTRNHVHNHDFSCADMERYVTKTAWGDIVVEEVRPAPSPYVPFDPDLAAIEAIEPEFVQELVGWDVNQVNLNNFSPIKTPSSRIPIRWVPTADWPEESLEEPTPQYESKLKWKKTNS